MKLVSVDETKGWQYTKDGERIMLELPQEKKLVDPNVFMKKSDGFTTHAQSAYNCNACYDEGVYLVASGSNCPSGSQYGSLLVMPYRKGTGNTKPDFCTQIFIPNGDDPTDPNSMFYRTSLSNAWNAWQEVASLSDILDKTYPEGAIYLSVNKTPSPAALFGGSWQVLNGGRALWITDHNDSEGADLSIEAGLPNITGTAQEVIFRKGTIAYNGVFSSSSDFGTYWDSNKGDSYQGRRVKVDFNASKSNSIYGASDTVQPPAYKVYAWKRVHYGGGSSGGGASEPEK